MILTFKDFKTLSLNLLYSGIHWSKRSELKEEWHWRTKQALLESTRRTFDRPVDISVTCKLKRPVDVDNSVVYAKFVIDSLKHEGIIKDDTYKEVRSLALSVEKADENEITVYIG